MNSNLAKVGKPYPMAAGSKRQSGWKTARHSDSLFSRLYSRFRAGSGLMREVIAAIREGLPEADQLQPGAVFQHVLEALQNCPNNSRNTNSSICSGEIRE
jgi:hypothetical protein